MKRLSGILATLLLGACVQDASTPTQITQSVSLTVHWADVAEMNVIAKAHGDPQIEREGYTVLVGHPGAFVCDIYMGKPTGVGGLTQALIGHELLHCLYGSYHP